MMRSCVESLFEVMSVWFGRSMRLMAAAVGMCCLVAAGLSAPPAGAEETKAARPAMRPGPRGRLIADPVAPASQPATSRVPPKIEVGELKHDFGAVWSGESVKHTFTLKNVGEGPLSILQVRSSCGCTVLGEYARTVEAGQPWELPIELHTTNQYDRVRKTITVTTNDPQQATVTFVIEGLVKTHFSYEPNRIVYFTLASRDVVETKTVIITNAQDKPVVIKSATCQSKSYTLNLREVEKGRKYELAVTTVPPVRDLQLQSIIQLQTDDPEHPVERMRAYAVVQARVTAAPRLLRFGVPVKQALRHRIEVRNVGPTLVHVTEVKTSVPGLKTEIEEIEKGVTYAVLVTLPEGAELPDAGVMVTVHTDDPEFAELIARLQPYRFPPPGVSATRPTPAASQPSTE